MSVSFLLTGPLREKAFVLSQLHLQSFIFQVYMAFISVYNSLCVNDVVLPLDVSISISFVSHNKILWEKLTHNCFMLTCLYYS